MDNLKAKLIESGFKADYDQEVANIKNLEEITISSLDDSMVEADFYLNSTNLKTQQQKIQRLVELLFGHPYHSPSIDEQGMMLAHVSKLRVVDLARQVGASITNDQGSIISTGCNEVPKAHGGMYWWTDHNDSRDFTLGSDLNKKLIDSMISTLIDELREIKLLNNDEATNKKMYEALDKAGFRNSIEFMRSTHAEMSAIADAAMHGKRLGGATIYTTTFPCHLCTRMIIASGIKRVVFLETYKKSKAVQMYNDSISINLTVNNEEKVNFELFEGIGPKRYLDFFKSKIRKHDDGKIIQWNILDNKKYDLFIPNLDIEKNEELFFKENKDILKKVKI